MDLVPFFDLWMKGFSTRFRCVIEVQCAGWCKGVGCGGAGGLYLRDLLRLLRVLVCPAQPVQGAVNGAKGARTFTRVGQGRLRRLL